MELDGQIIITGPKDVFELIGQEVRTLEHEVVKLISLDAQNRMINCETISNGGAGITLLRPRDVFERAFKNSAIFIILVHNHPSGGPEPSGSDIEVTRKIARIGKMIGVWLQDHVIVGKNNFVSLRARRIIGS